MINIFFQNVVYNVRHINPIQTSGQKFLLKLLKLLTDKDFAFLTFNYNHFDVFWLTLRPVQGLFQILCGFCRTGILEIGELKKHKIGQKSKKYCSKSFQT